MNDTIGYVTSVPYFWLSMGLTISTAMFIGATMYNGDLRKFSKALIGILSYGFFLFAITATRLYDTGTTVGFKSSTLAHAGIFTLAFVTVAYVLGMFIGVMVTNYAKHHSKKD
jgi:hypothetical protein